MSGPVSPDLSCAQCVTAAGKTPGQAAQEMSARILRERFGDIVLPWHEASDDTRAGWETIAQAAIATLGIEPDRLELLADWFDADDEFKTTMFPDARPQRGNEVQSDLRRWAKRLRAGLEKP